MSLKAFHIFFIALSILLLAGFAIWSFQSYSSTGAMSQLLFTILSAVGSVLLVFYGMQFLKKMKGLTT